MELLNTSRKTFGSCVESLKSLVQKVAATSYEAVLLITSEHQNSTSKMRTNVDADPDQFSEEFLSWRAAVAERKPLASCSRNYSVSPYEDSNPGTSQVELMPVYRASGSSGVKRDRFPATTHTATRKKPVRHKFDRRISPNVVATGCSRSPAPLANNPQIWEHLIDNTEKQIDATKTSLNLLLPATERNPTMLVTFIIVTMILWKYFGDPKKLVNRVSPSPTRTTPTVRAVPSKSIYSHQSPQPQGFVPQRSAKLQISPTKGFCPQALLPPISPKTIISGSPKTIISGSPKTIISGSPKTIISGSPKTLLPAVSPKTVFPAASPKTIFPPVSPKTIFPSVSPKIIFPPVSPKTTFPPVSPKVVGNPRGMPPQSPSKMQQHSLTPTDLSLSDRFSPFVTRCASH